MALGLFTSAGRGGTGENEKADKYFRKQTGLETTKTITEGWETGMKGK